MAVYQWKLDGLFNVDPNVAGAELERIYNENGAIEPAVVVEQSRPKSAPLHPLFEWDDKAAAQKYREQQARTVIANVVVVGEPEKDTCTRAFVHVEQSYHPLEIVLASRDMSAELLHCAYRDMRTFETKYSELQELASVFDAMEDVMS